jgi:hypothetical protein
MPLTELGADIEIVTQKLVELKPELERALGKAAAFFLYVSMSS